MTYFWFLVAVLFFVLWLRKKPASPEASPQISAAYDRGFLDGWKDLSFKLESEISNDVIRHDDLCKYMNLDAVRRARAPQSAQAGSAPGVPAGPANVLPVSPTTAGQPPLQQPSPLHGAPVSPAAGAVPPPGWAAHTAAQPTPMPQSVYRVGGAPPRQPMPPVRSESAEERKERVARRNLNVMLYVASFFLVAAAAAFIASSAPTVIRLTLLWGVSGVFYLGGLGLYWRSVVLRPAAISFVGTGLAILPFAGLSLHLLAHVAPTSAWFITSIVGLVAYLIATIVLQKAVIAYLTLAFVLSLSTSSVNVLHLPLVWSFVSLMAVGLLAHLVTSFWPKALPGVFAEPLDQTAQFVTPLALLASLTAVSSMPLGEYALVFGVAALQYLVYWVQQRDYVNEIITRVLALVSLTLLGLHLAAGDYLFISWWIVSLICVNALYSLIRVQLDAPESLNFERIWLCASLAALVGSISSWFWANQFALGTSINLSLIILIAGVCILRFRDPLWAYAALAASIALPLAVGEWLSHVDWIAQIHPWLFLAASSAVLWIIYKSALTGRFVQAQSVAVVAYCTYLGAATAMAIHSFVELLSYNVMLVSVWLSLFSALAAISTFIYSYVRHQLMGELVAIGYLALSLGAFVWNLSDDHTWHSLIVVGVLYVLVVLAGILHTSRREQGRAVLAFTVAQGVGLFLAVGLVQEETRLVAMLLVLALALGSAARYFFGNDGGFLSHIYAFSTIPYFALAAGGTFFLNAGWQVLVLASIAGTYWCMTYRAKQPLIAAGANGGALGAVVAVVNWIGVPMEWWGLSAGLSSALIFAIWYAVVAMRKDWERAWIHVISLWFALGAGSFVGFGSSKPVMLAACGTLALLAVAVAVHGYFLRRAVYLDIAAFIFSFATQAAIYLAWDGVPAIIFGHLSALTLLAVALWRKRNGGDNELHYVLGAVVFTMGGGASALADGSVYQLIFLAEHVVILIVGALRQWQRVVWWGVAASVTAIMYFLKDYFYLWLAFLGVILIAIVVWRLMRINNAKQLGGYQQPPNGYQQPPGDQYAPNGYQQGGYPQFPSEHQQAGEYPGEHPGEQPREYPNDPNPLR